MRLKDANGMQNSVDPDLAAYFGANQSGSALFAQTHLSRYLDFCDILYSTDMLHCMNRYHCVDINRTSFK